MRAGELFPKGALSQGLTSAEPLVCPSVLSQEETRGGKQEYEVSRSNIEPVHGKRMKNPWRVCCNQYYLGHATVYIPRVGSRQPCLQDQISKAETRIAFPPQGWLCYPGYRMLLAFAWVERYSRCFQIIHAYILISHTENGLPRVIGCRLGQQQYSTFPYSSRRRLCAGEVVSPRWLAFQQNTIQHSVGMNGGGKRVGIGVN